MSQELKVGETVLAFFHPLGSYPNPYSCDSYDEGVVVSKMELGYGTIVYKVKSKSNDYEYSGLYGQVSSDNYYFLRKKDYIEHLKFIISELDEKKRTYKKIIGELTGGKTK